MSCRQLGLQLHVLDTPLPLYDGQTGLLVPQHTDTRVERLRDALMDSARERVEDLGEAAVEGNTYPVQQSLFVVELAVSSSARARAAVEGQGVLACRTFVVWGLLLR